MSHDGSWSRRLRRWLVGALCSALALYALVCWREGQLVDPIQFTRRLFQEKTDPYVPSREEQRLESKFDAEMAEWRRENDQRQQEIERQKAERAKTR